jgi:hypothetical protein
MVILIMVTLCGLLLPLSARTAEEAAGLGITNRVQALLDAYAGADDLMDEQLLKKRAELESMGAAAVPALCAILKKENDPIYQARIIEVFSHTDGDGNESLNAVREFLKTHRDGKYAPAHQAALEYLGAKGGEEDASILREYLSIDDLVTKTTAWKSKGMIEKRVADRTHAIGATNNVSRDTGK